MNFKLLTIQLFITIVFIFLGLLLIIEIPPLALIYFQSKILNKNFKQRCNDIVLNQINFKYASCPNNVYVKQGGLDYPIIKETLSYTDGFGGRVNKNSLGKNFDKNEFNLFLIGDSFIQADELPYEKTVYGIINNSTNSKNFKAYGFGFSSWNTQEYLSSIKAINANNSLYDVFLFPNDITPSYRKSRYASSRKKLIDSKNSTNKNFFKNRLSKSITFQKLKELYLNKKSKIITEKFWLQYPKEKDKCQYLENNKDFLSTRLVDYIYYSLPYKCWTEIHRESYRLVLEDIENMKEEAYKRNSKIRFIYLPPGFSFQNENFPGRTHRYYGIPKNIELKLSGLVQKFKNDIPTSFVDLDKAISIELSRYKQKKDCKTEKCNNLFYYPYDGHLNHQGHNFLYEYLYLNSSYNFKY